MFVQVAKDKWVSVNSITSIEVIDGNYILNTKSGPVHIMPDFVDLIKKLINKT